MKVSVNEQAQRFFLAANEWVGAVGHEIKVGDYRFCAIPMTGGINVSEISTGAKVTSIPMSQGVRLALATKDDLVKFLYKVGEHLQGLIKKANNFDNTIESMKKTVFERLGEMPPIEDIDIDLIYLEYTHPLKRS